MGIRLFDKDENETEQSSAIFSDDSPTIIQFPASKAMKLLTYKMVVNATMREKEQGSMGIKYLIVKGEKWSLPNTVRDRANVSKRPTTFVDPKESPHAPKIKAFG